MANADIAIQIVTKGANLAKKQLDGVGNSAGKSSGKFSKFSKHAKLAGLAVGVVLAKGLSSAVREFTAFDDKMTQSVAIMDTTIEQQKAMEEQALAVSRTTRIGAEQSAEAYFFLASAGLNAEQSISALPQVAKFAQAGMFDMATATDLATDAQSALGLTVSDAEQNLSNLTRVTDVLVKANTLANASVQQFSEALTNKAGSALKVANKSIEEGVAVLSAFADRGVKGAEAGEKLNQLLRDIPRATAKNGEEFKKLGLSMFDAQGNMKNVADLIEELDRVLAPMSDELKASTLDQLGLNRGVADAVKILSGAGDQIRGYEEKLKSAGGMTAEVADKQMGSLKAQTDLMKNAFSELGIIIGSLVVEPLTKLVKWITKTTHAITSAVQTFKDWKDAVKESNAEIQKNIHGVNYSAEAFRNYEKAVEEVNEVVQDEIDLIHEQNGALQEQNNRRARNKDMLDRIRNTYVDTSESVDEYVEKINEEAEAQEKLAQERKNKALPSLQALVDAQEALADIQERIKDAEEDRDDAVKDVTKADNLHKKAIEKKEKTYQEMLDAQEEATKVTLEEKLAILQQEEAVKKLQEAEEKNEIQELKLTLAKRKLEEMIKASTSANYESESAVRAYEQAVKDEERALENLTKAQDALTEAQEEFNEVTAKTPKNLLEIALAKKELDDAIADIKSLGTFEEALSQMVSKTGMQLGKLKDMFGALMFGENASASSILGGAGAGAGVGAGSEMTDITGAKALNNVLSDNRFAFQQGQRGGVTTILNIAQTVEGSVVSEQQFSDAVAIAVREAQRNGTTVAL